LNKHAWTEIRLWNRGGIGFDDLRFAPELRRVLVPAGRTGQLGLVEPRSLKLSAIGGFAGAALPFTGGHEQGVTSADEGQGYLFATDRTSRRLYVIEPRRQRVLASGPLAASPDYVRYVASRNEIWVTEPEREQIEIFAGPTDAHPTPAHLGVVRVAGGPESIQVDERRQRVFTHLWRSKTVAIGIAERAILTTWANGCKGSRGIAEDVEQGFLFVGCTEGRVTTLDVDRDGALRGSIAAPGGVDIIAYNEILHHVYAPGSDSGQLSVLLVASDGGLKEIGNLPIERGSHCVAADDQRQLWLCDPFRGRLLVTKDTF
jgi:hypothetical protein